MSHQPNQNDTVIRCPDCGKIISTRFAIHECKPLKKATGLLQGQPLWKYAEGRQVEMPIGDFSCLSGHCGH